MTIPENLERLHDSEEQLRQKAIAFAVSDERLAQHLSIIERAMDLCDTLRQYLTDDEDLKVVQIFSMRMFNAFGASVKLALSGYHQNAALVLRDVLETVFLLDLFEHDRTAIRRWRLADKQARMKEFRPIKVREVLDTRDGFTSKKRADLYELFSELAGHPSMKASWMLRPERYGDAVIGPFMEKTALVAVLSEGGRLAVQAGGHLLPFFPAGWNATAPALTSFKLVRAQWIETFYGDVMGEVVARGPIDRGTKKCAEE